MFLARIQADAATLPLRRWRWNLALLLVTLAAVAIRWYYLSHALVIEPVRGDAVQYHAYAWNLVHHGVFSHALPDSGSVASDSFRDPGYPFFLAVGMKLFDSFEAWYAAILMAQAFLGAFTVSLLMMAAREWIADRWLIGAGLLMAFWPHSITITGFLLSETLFGFLCALAFYLLRRSMHRQSTGWLAASGLCFGLAALTNAVLVPFGVLLAGALLLSRRMTARLAIVLALAALALPVAWGLRSLQLPSSGASSSGRALMNLVQGSWPTYHSGYRAYVSGDPEGKRIMQAIQREMDVTLADPVEGLRLMATRMAGKPLHYLAWYLSKPARLWGWSIQIGQGDIYVYPTLNSPLDANPVLRAWVSFCRAINPMLLALALAGLVLSLRERKSVACMAMGLLTLYATLLYATLQAEPRYSIPFKGLELLLATHALHRLIVWVKAKKESMPKDRTDTVA